MLRQIDRAHRDFSDEQIEFLSNVAGLYRVEQPGWANSTNALFAQPFPVGAYRDVTGLRTVAIIDEIEAQGSSLNPGRYVELRTLNARAATLQRGVDDVISQIVADDL